MDQFLFWIARINRAMTKVVHFYFPIFGTGFFWFVSEDRGDSGNGRRISFLIAAVSGRDPAFPRDKLRTGNKVDRPSPSTQQKRLNMGRARTEGEDIGTAWGEPARRRQGRHKALPGRAVKKEIGNGCASGGSNGGWTYKLQGL